MTGQTEVIAERPVTGCEKGCPAAPPVWLAQTLDRCTS